MANAYYGANLSLTDPKHFPRTFEDFYPDKEDARGFDKPQTESEIGAAFMKFAIQAGGLETEKVD